MTTIRLTQAKYTNAIALGYYDELENISKIRKIVKHYKLCGWTEELLIEITNN